MASKEEGCAAGKCLENGFEKFFQKSENGESVIFTLLE